MKKLLLLAACGLLLSCSTAQLPSDATAEQKRLALCQDAKTAYLLSVVMLDKFTSANPGAVIYWESYKAGAELAIETYCPTSTK